MTTTEPSAQSITYQQRAKRAEFYALWDTTIKPRIASLATHAPKNHSPAQIALAMAEEAAWMAFNREA